jgi:HD-GYP domain-containing protein (c-di-GMP phosphodiesterase class II)/CHASE2 domain-containing sensor protein
MTGGAQRGRPRVAALAAVLAVTLGTVGAAQVSGALDPPERASVATRFQLRETQRPNDVVVVGIDDVTFGDLGRQWPFPRSLHARAIDNLHRAGAREIVYDVQFTEPTAPEEDRALFEAIRRAGGAVLATSETDAHGRTNVLGGDANLATVDARAAAANLVNDPGGSVTRFPHRVGKLASIAAVTARRVLGHPVAFPPGGGDPWIDYRGGPGAIPSLHFSDVVRGRFDPVTVRGKVVVVGAEAPSLRDVHATPGQGDLMSGPEVQANAIWTAIHAFPLRDAPLALDLLLALLLAALPLIARIRAGVLASAGVAIAGAAAFALAAKLAFDAGTVLVVTPPLAALAASTVGMVVMSYLTESRERRRVAHDNELLEARVRERTDALERTQLDTVRRLATAVESRDAETGHHIDRIGLLCERLALASGLDARAAEAIRHAAALHDLGKIAIPDAVLLKPGKLDAEEWALMQTHTTAGAHVLEGSQSELLQLGEAIALTHHERWDGGGYPAGLAGEEIPLAGRICAVCDTYDAMISKRPYKDAGAPEDALAEIERQAGRQFDPRLVGAFLTLRDDLLAETRQPPPDAPLEDELTMPACATGELAPHM